jgi:hypothetical protein
MNRNFALKLMALVALALGTLGTAYADDDSPACDNRTLSGNYGFTIEGLKLGGPGPVGSQVGVAMAQFDGQGTFTQIDSVTINGVQVSKLTNSPANGTYTVNSDCTGSFRINFTDGRSPVNADFVVVGMGDEIDTVVTSVVVPGAGNTQGILATRSIGKRVSRRR